MTDERPEEAQPVPCPACGGSGQVVVGEEFCTRDMAIDAGDREMEGMSLGPVWSICDECGGGGLLEQDR